MRTAGIWTGKRGKLLDTKPLAVVCMVMKIPMTENPHKLKKFHRSSKTMLLFYQKIMVFHIPQMKPARALSNAIIKAEALFSEAPVLADDSGLVVKLNGNPGAVCKVRFKGGWPRAFKWNETAFSCNERYG